MAESPSLETFLSASTKTNWLWPHSWATCSASFKAIRSINFQPSTYHNTIELLLLDSLEEEKTSIPHTWSYSGMCLRVGPWAPHWEGWRLPPSPPSPFTNLSNCSTLWRRLSTSDSIFFARLSTAAARGGRHLHFPTQIWPICNYKIWVVITNVECLEIICMWAVEKKTLGKKSTFHLIISRSAASYLESMICS